MFNFPNIFIFSKDNFQKSWKIKTPISIYLYINRWMLSLLLVGDRLMVGKWWFGMWVGVDGQSVEVWIGFLSRSNLRIAHKSNPRTYQLYPYQGSIWGSAKRSWRGHDRKFEKILFLAKSRHVSWFYDAKGSVKSFKKLPKICK